MPVKSKLVAVRLEPRQLNKLIAWSLAAGDGGNMSAGLRYMVDQSPEVELEKIRWLEKHNDGAKVSQAERTVVAA